MKNGEKERLPIWKKGDYDLINTGIRQTVLAYPMDFESLLKILKSNPFPPSLIERLLQGFEVEALTILDKAIPMIENHQKNKPSSKPDAIKKRLDYDLTGNKLHAKSHSAQKVLIAANDVREAIKTNDTERAITDTMRLVYAAVTADLYDLVFDGIRGKGGRKRAGQTDRSKHGIVLAIQAILPKLRKRTPLELWNYFKENHRGKSKGLWVGNYYGLPRYQIYFYPEIKLEKSLLVQFDEITNEESSMVFSSFVRLFYKEKKKLQ